MRKKLLFRYGILSIPFICGLSLYVIGSFNIISSLLFFIGGYILIKNLCDYRMIKRNIYNIEKRYSNLNNNINKDKSNEMKIESTKCSSILIDEIKNNEKQINNSNKKKYQSYEDIPGIKRVRSYKKVRRKY